MLAMAHLLLFREGWLAEAPSARGRDGDGHLDFLRRTNQANLGVCASRTPQPPRKHRSIVPHAHRKRGGGVVAINNVCTGNMFSPLKGRRGGHRAYVHRPHTLSTRFAQKMQRRKNNGSLPPRPRAPQHHRHHHASCPWRLTSSSPREPSSVLRLLVRSPISATVRRATSKKHNKYEHTKHTSN